MNAECVSPNEKPSYIENLGFLDLNVSMHNTVSLTLKWTTLNNPIDPITHCNVYASNLLGIAKDTRWKGENIYLGAAYANCFRVHCMHMLTNDLKEQLFGLEFKVQPVTSARRKPSVDNADSITVWFNP